MNLIDFPSLDGRKILVQAEVTARAEFRNLSRSRKTDYKIAWLAQIIH